MHDQLTPQDAGFSFRDCGLQFAAAWDEKELRFVNEAPARRDPEVVKLQLKAAQELSREGLFDRRVDAFAQLTAFAAMLRDQGHETEAQIQEELLAEAISDWLEDVGDAGILGCDAADLPWALAAAERAVDYQTETD